MNQSEVLSVSPDNRYRVEVAPREARNTLWTQADLSVVIDCERRTADCGDGPQIGLSRLESTLEQMLDLPG